jgi:hypothetical protein
MKMLSNALAIMLMLFIAALVLITAPALIPDTHASPAPVFSGDPPAPQPTLSSAQYRVRIH